MRESLDTRIELLLMRQRQGIGPNFINAALPDFGFDAKSFRSQQQSSLTKQMNNLQIKKKKKRRPRLRDEILSTPPSPFLSASDYVKWFKHTALVDAGYNPSDLDEADYDELFESQDNSSADGTPLKDEPTTRRRRRTLDGDDDRMSLSSLSSGEKLEVGNGSSRHHHHQPYQHQDDQAQLVSAWKHGEPPAGYANGDQYPLPASQYHSFQYSNYESQSQPYGKDAYYDYSGHDVMRGEDYLEWHRQNNESRREHMSQIVLDAIVAELKEVIKKDVAKKMIESTGYKCYADWWNDEEARYKQRDKQRLERQLSNQSKPAPISSYRPAHETFNRIQAERAGWSTMHRPFSYDHNRQESLFDRNMGLGLGLRAVIPKMPSFRRIKRVVKPSSPPHEDDYIKNRHDSDDEKTDKNKTDDYAAITSDNVQKNRAAAVIEKPLSSSSEESSDEESAAKSSESEVDSSDLSSEESESESSSEPSDESSSASESSASSKDSKTKKKVLSKKKSKQIVSSDSEDEEQDTGKEAQATAPEEPLPPPDDSLTRVDIEGAEALMALAGGFGAKPAPPPKANSDTDSASESERIEEARRPKTVVDAEHNYCRSAAEMVPADIDLVIDSVARGGKKGKARKQPSAGEHGYSREKPAAKPKKTPVKKTKTNVENVDPSLFAIASEWRNAKRANASTVPLDMIENLEPRRPPTPKPTYKVRSAAEEKDILFEFLRTGIDSEDIQYLKRSYESMLQEDSQFWLNDTHWVDHPPTASGQPPKKKKKNDDTRVHVTGCARSEGYYKMDVDEKWAHSHVTNAGEQEEAAQKELRARGAVAQQSNREARSNQRRLLATVDAAWSDLLKFNQLQVIDQLSLW